MKEIIGLHGKAYNGTPYTVNIVITNNKIEEMILCGKPCKSVKDIVNDFANLQAKNAENVINTIKLKMLQHNEYVQTVKK